MSANAEIIAELRRVLNERDEAREQLDLTKRELGRWVDREAKAVRERDEWRDKFHALNQTAGELCNACGWAFKIPGEPCRCEVVKERDEARASLAQIRRVFGNAIAFDDARGDIVKMAEIAYRGACDGDKAVGELRGVTRQRDEALARCETLRELADAAAYEQGLAQRRMMEAQRERDEARADAERYLADLRRCASEPYERTRELEALQAEVERLRETKDYLRTWLSSEELEGLRVKAAEHPLLWEEIHHLKAEVERLREKYDSVLEANVGLLDGAPYVDARVAFRRGAEAMREACAVALMSDGLVLSRERAANVVRALPIPEEP